MDEHGGNIHRFDSTMVDFSANINPLGIPESLKNAWMERMNEVTCYPDPKYRKLKKAISDHLHLPHQAEIVLGNGAVDLIHEVVVCTAPNEVLIPSPAFSEYRLAATRSKVPFCEPVLYDREGHLQTEKLLQEIREGSLVFLCSPNNPTGKVLDEKALARIYHQIEKTQSFLMLDETFLSFTEASERHGLMSSQPERMIFLRALTKIYGIPGVRLGYGILFNRDLAEKMTAHQQPWHINTFADIAGQVVLKDTDYLERTRSWLKAEKAFLYRELSKIAWIRFIESDCNFILVQSQKHTAEVIQKQLLQEMILIRMPSGFKGLSPYHFRIAVKDRNSNLKLIKALQHLDD